MEKNTRGYLTADEIYDRTMKEIVALPCQESYARKLSAIFSYHMKKNYLMDMGFSADELPQQSAVIVAPSGQGKSFLLRKMAQVCGVNAVVIECTTIAHEGWRGINLSEKLASEKKSVPTWKFERSVILVDEVDKLHNWGTENDQGNAQENFLQLFSGDPINYKADRNSPVEAIETRRWTVLLAGAFAGLEKIVADRIACKRSIGFTGTAENRELTTAELMERAIPADLTKYGMMNELVGRIGSVISIRPMEQEDYRLLVSGGSRSALDKYKKYFSSLYGASVDITDRAVEAIARQCMGSQTGARAVNPLIDAQMREAMPMLDRDSEIGRIVLDTDGSEVAMRYEKAPREKPRLVYGIPAEFKVKAKPEAETEKMPETAFLKDSYKVTENGQLVIQSDSVQSAAWHICALFENTDVDWSAETLYEFLRCAMSYLHAKEPEKAIALSEVFRLAVDVQKRTRQSQSQFDALLRSYVTESEDLSNSYQWLRSTWDENLAYNLVMALNAVSQRLWQQFQKDDVYFAVAEDRQAGAE